MSDFSGKSKTESKKKPVQKRSWTVYIIEAENGFLYTGITTDLSSRFQKHLIGKSGAKFFRRSPPKEIVFSKKGFTHSRALKKEAQIKKLSKKEKLELIHSQVEVVRSVVKFNRLLKI